MGRAGWAGGLTVVAVATVLLTGCGAEVAGVASGGVSRSLSSPSLPSTGTGGSTGTRSTSETTGPTTQATTSLPTTSSRSADTPPGTSASRTAPSRPATTAAVTASLGDSGAIEVGSPSATIVLDVYEEPLCPPCAAFSERYGAQIAAAVLSGRVTVRFRVANFFDGRSHSKNYSTRAIAALLTVLAYDRDPRTLLAVHEAIFDKRNQPVEDSGKDLTDAQLAALAEQHGAGTGSAEAIRKGVVRASAVATARLTASYLAEQRVSGVPAVQVNGTTVDIDDADWLTKALGG